MAGLRELQKMLREGPAEGTGSEKLTRSVSLIGKKAVVFGVATEQSIAWRIAKTLNDNGCRVALAYQERLDKYVRALAQNLNEPVLGPCDVLNDDQVANFFMLIKEEFGSYDFLIHSIAFAKRNFLQGKFFEIDREGFSAAQEVSAYSLAALVKASGTLLKNDGRVLTMSYLGSQRAMPNYNIMGVCKAALEASVRYLAADLGERGISVNAISAGPIRTLAASAIGDFESILTAIEQKAPLKRNISTQDVADLALFLCSELARNITGQVMYVDAGYSIVGM